MKPANSSALQQRLKPIHLWAIAVGLVISGEYFGWNYGWGVSGTIGFLIATAVVTVMYITFIFSFTELTTSIPHAGGPFAYAYRAMGPLAGFIAGYATLVDFLLATPAIAFALGNYLHFLYPSIPVLSSAVFFNIIFILVNISGIKESANFSLFITLLAVAELLLFFGIIAPHFKTDNFLANPIPLGWQGIFAALPYAVWFYLAIEGVAMVAEEVKNPARNIPKGYISALITLVFLAMGVMILTGGVGDWRKLSTIDYPLPEAIGMTLGKDNALTKLFASIGLFGLIASFHGTILASSRQVFAMARSGYLPGFLSTVNRRFKTPHWAIAASGVISSVALYTGTTSQVIILAVLGAVVMYIISMISLFVLRYKEPGLHRPFRSPLYPLFPAVALVLSALCLIAIVYYNVWLSCIFFAGLVVAVLIFIITGRHKIKPADEMLLEKETGVVLSVKSI